MITTTHVVTNALIARNRRASGHGLLADTANAKWFIVGGLAPDLGLYALTAGAAIYFPLATDMSFAESMQHAFDDLFFNNPVWIVVQNTLHSPVILGALAATGKLTDRPRLLSFALGSLLHTAMDIPVHHNDGPLVFFPFDWSTRVNSPVSYYDADHYGNIVAPIDIAITVLGGAFLARTWWRNRNG